VLCEVQGYKKGYLFLSCDKEIAKQRFQTRRLPGRLDEDVQMFEKRYGEYELLNRKVIEYYQAMGTLVEVRLAS
jgi:adenylate kinase family enzyme